MIYLILCILLHTGLGFIFKFFPRYKVDLLEAVVVNYFVCSLTAFLVFGVVPLEDSWWSAGWWPFALVLGTLFIIGFNFVGLAVQYLGVTVAVVLQKMSLVFSAGAAILLYQEPAGFVKVTAIFVGLAAIWFTNYNPVYSTDARLKMRTLYLGGGTLLLSACIEIILQYSEENVLEQSGDPAFVSASFFFAALLGSVWWLFRRQRPGGRLRKRNILAGIVLGVPNFFSIYLLLLALGSGLGGSVVFPANNVSIIALTAIITYLVFREGLNRYNFAGVFCAMLTILLLALS